MQNEQSVAEAPKVVLHEQPQDKNAPEGCIFTTKGFIPLYMLVKTETVTDEEEVTATATEYRLDGELVRRDVNLALKPKQILNIEAQEL